MEKFDKEMEEFQKSKAHSLMEEINNKISVNLNALVNISTLNVTVSQRELHNEIKKRIKEKIQIMSKYDLIETYQLCKWCGTENVDWKLYIIAKIYKDLFWEKFKEIEPNESEDGE